MPPKDKKTRTSSPIASKRRKANLEGSGIPTEHEEEPFSPFLGPVQNKRLSETVPSHTYEPLQSPTSIRILELLPGEEGDLIQCQLYSTTVEGAPQYEALSYVWGSPDDKSAIECGGGRIKIPTNLRDLLQRLRSPSKVRRLWADAICINQSDSKEVGHQVRQMASIYSAAERVIIWLGMEDPFIHLEEDEQPLTLIQRLCQRQDESTDSETSHTSTATPELLLHSFGELLERPWFGRLWVLQEAGLARSALAMFGGREVDFDDLICTAAKVNNDEKLLSHCAGIFKPLTIFLSYPNRRPESFSTPSIVQDFLDLLQVTKMQLASDPRDFIFALLGHPSAQADGVLIIEPNYQKTHQKIHQELAFTLLRQSQDLRVLCAVRHCDQNDLNYGGPSWVPTWNRNAVTASVGVYKADWQFGEADAGIRRNIQFSEAGNVIQVHGLAFDRIKEYTREFKGDYGKRFPVGHTYFKNWPLAEAIALSATSEFPTREKLLDLLSALLGWGPYSYMLERDFAALCLELSKKKAKQSCVSPDDLLPEGLVAAEEVARGGNAKAFIDESESFIMGKRMFVTKGGLIGCGPTVLSFGDICCILFGSRVPFLLRPVGSAYRLVGEVYIPRAMQGEAVVDWLLGDKIQDQHFNIF
jgi:hypothetical protein